MHKSQTTSKNELNDFW